METPQWPSLLPWSSVVWATVEKRAGRKQYTVNLASHRLGRPLLLHIAFALIGWARKRRRWTSSESSGPRSPASTQAERRDELYLHSTELLRSHQRQALFEEGKKTKFKRAQKSHAASYLCLTNVPLLFELATLCSRAGPRQFTVWSCAHLL